MSTYKSNTKHPNTGKTENALWMDDYFGQHNYGVKFPSEPDMVYHACSVWGCIAPCLLNENHTEKPVSWSGVGKNAPEPKISPEEIVKRIEEAGIKPEDVVLATHPEGCGTPDLKEGYTPFTTGGIHAQAILDSLPEPDLKESQEERDFLKEGKSICEKAVVEDFYEGGWDCEAGYNFTDDEKVFIEAMGWFLPRHMPHYDWNKPFAEMIALMHREVFSKTLTKVSEARKDEREGCIADAEEVMRDTNVIEGIKRGGIQDVIQALRKRNEEV